MRHLHPTPYTPHPAFLTTSGHNGHRILCRKGRWRRSVSTVLQPALGRMTRRFARRRVTRRTGHRTLSRQVGLRHNACTESRCPTDAAMVDSDWDWESPVASEP